MTLNTQKLFEDMAGAAKSSFGKQWKDVEGYALPELSKFAKNITEIAELKLSGEISEEQAKIHLAMQKKAMAIVMLTAKGLTILAVEAAINAAIDVVRGAVNTSIGWQIL